MTEKFRPDGSEDRALFFSAWCFQCQRDRAMREGADIDECDGGEADLTQEEMIAEALAEDAFGGGFSYPPGRA